MSAKLNAMQNVLIILTSEYVRRPGKKKKTQNSNEYIMNALAFLISDYTLCITLNNKRHVLC